MFPVNTSMENVLAFLDIPTRKTCPVCGGTGIDAGKKCYVLVRRTSREILYDLLETLYEKKYFGNPELKKMVGELDIEDANCARELILLMAYLKDILGV